MKPPKTPVEFDYILWTTKDGKSMVRVKSTGEVTEVSKETMRFLRAEERRCRHYDSRILSDTEKETISLSDLSTDNLPSEKLSMSSWLTDPADFTQDIITAAVEDEFYVSLTPAQKEIYDEVLKGGTRPSHYAMAHGISPSSVTQHIRAIQKKAKKFF